MKCRDFFLPESLHLCVSAISQLSVKHASMVFNIHTFDYFAQFHISESFLLSTVYPVLVHDKSVRKDMTQNAVRTLFHRRTANCAEVANQNYNLYFIENSKNNTAALFKSYRHV